MKFQQGDVVYLKSAFISGGVPSIVLDAHEETDVDHEKYDLLTQSRNGEALNKFTVPLYAICGVNGEGMPQELAS